MLDFIFKYTWIGMIILVYIIWSIASIKDIIETARIWQDEFDMDILDEGTTVWIVVTLAAIFGASLLYFLLGGAE